MTLGGGLGWLLGEHGATCDNLQSVKLVTADGEIRSASVAGNEDLFWALRGGGGNFGIATEFEYTTHPVGKVIAGHIAYSATHLADFLSFYNEFMASAPDALTVEITVTPASEPLIVAVVCYKGEQRAAASVLRPLLGFGPPLANSISEVSYARLADPAMDLMKRFERPPSATPVDHSAPYHSYWQGASISDWSDDAIGTFVEAYRTAPTDFSIGLGHYIHGRISEVDDEATALVRRKGSFSYFFNTSWRSTTHTAEVMSWVDASIEAMRPYGDPTYINYLSSNEPDAVAAAYGKNYTRLRALKSRFDPDNVFQMNRNIRA